MNKRASENILSEIVLIVASIIIFSILLIFISKAVTSSLFYEELYAKKIGLSIEASVPGTVLEFDISEPYRISKLNKLFGNSFEESFRREFFYFNETDQSVRIKMATTGGFVFKLMSNRTIDNPTVNINEKSQVLLLKVGGPNE